MKELENVSFSCAQWKFSDVLVKKTNNAEARALITAFGDLERDCSSLHKEILNVYDALPPDSENDPARNEIVAMNENSCRALLYRARNLVDRARIIERQPQ